MTDIVSIVWSILGATGIMILGLVSVGVQRLISTVFKNTLAIELLTSQLKDILNAKDKINKLEKDINEAHKKLRDLGGKSI